MIYTVWYWGKRLQSCYCSSNGELAFCLADNLHRLGYRPWVEAKLKP